jgi:hypothetical protein
MKGISGMQDNGDSFDAAGWCTGIFEEYKGRREHGKTVVVGQEIGMGKKGCPLKEAVRDKNGVVGVMSGVYEVCLGGWALVLALGLALTGVKGHLFEIWKRRGIGYEYGLSGGSLWIAA